MTDSWFIARHRVMHRTSWYARADSWTRVATREGEITMYTEGRRERTDERAARRFCEFLYVTIVRLHLPAADLAPLFPWCLRYFFAVAVRPFSNIVHTLVRVSLQRRHVRYALLFGYTAAIFAFCWPTMKLAIVPWSLNSRFARFARPLARGHATAARADVTWRTMYQDRRMLRACPACNFHMTNEITWYARMRRIIHVIRYISKQWIKMHFRSEF